MTRAPGSPERTYLIFREKVVAARFRRVVDFVLAGTLLTLAVPLLVAAALAIYLEDRGPAVFVQRRAGRFERLFSIYKLRTMRVANCDDRPSPTSAFDDRITKVGRILRKTSIDELPQLLNVLRGEMSLVGPRPEMGLITRGYRKWQHLRHLISPGLTCIWQTTCRSTLPLDRPEATALDLDYIERASPALDIVLLLRTVGTVVLRKGAF